MTKPFICFLAALAAVGCSGGESKFPREVGPITVQGEGNIAADTSLDGKPVQLRALVQADHGATPEEEAAGTAWIGRFSLRYGIFKVACVKATGQDAECDAALDLSPARPESGPTIGDPGSTSASP